MVLLIKNGRIIDPGTKTDQVADMLIKKGTIEKIAPNMNVKADRILNAKGCYVMPGFIDLHVHLRDPGFEYKETVETGAKAAVKGGFTTIVAMPNTRPVVDRADVANYVHNKAKDVGLANVLQVGAITKGQLGIELSDIEEMIEAGVLAISEDGKSVMNSRLYREAMTLAAKFAIPVLAHCEDSNLAGEGIMNADKKAEQLGLPGITNAVEDVIIARDILLAKETGCRLHICHCSTKDSVKMVRAARHAGVKVTAEVCPHHFTLSTDDIEADNANYKMNPPLRRREDVEALIAGLKDDSMDVIATDHAPHSLTEKYLPMREAPFGIVGLETAAALTMTELVIPGYITPMQMAEKMSYNPAGIIGLDKGSLAPGKAADIVIFDPDKKYRINKNMFVSRSKNTPFHGREVIGRVRATIVNGMVVYEDQ